MASTGYVSVKNREFLNLTDKIKTAKIVLLGKNKYFLGKDKYSPGKREKFTKIPNGRHFYIRRNFIEVIFLPKNRRQNAAVFLSSLTEFYKLKLFG
jgi:hypothetical protein